MHMHNILADECVHKDMINALRLAGHKILTARDATLSGATDETIFSYAVKNRLVLFTFDRGFGDIFAFNIADSSGVVIERINLMTKDEMIEIAVAFFNEQKDLQGKLIIIDKMRIRIISR